MKGIPSVKSFCISVSADTPVILMPLRTTLLGSAACLTDNLGFFYEILSLRG